MQHLVSSQAEQFSGGCFQTFHLRGSRNKTLLSLPSLWETNGQYPHALQGTGVLRVKGGVIPGGRQDPGGVAVGQRGGPDDRLAPQQEVLGGQVRDIAIKERAHLSQVWREDHEGNGPHSAAGRQGDILLKE